MTKEKWLDQNGRLLDGLPIKFDDIPHDKILVCLVDNGPFRAAGLIEDQLDFDDFTESKIDTRPKKWFYISKDAVW